MNTYLALKTLHILSACTLVGPLALTTRWTHLTRSEIGQSVLHDLHRLTGLSGWLVLISGAAMLALQHGAMLSAQWMQLSIALFVLVQMIDHFWADPREDELEKNAHPSTRTLTLWLILKLAIYGLITLLMVAKLSL